VSNGSYGSGGSRRYVLFPLSSISVVSSTREEDLMKRRISEVRVRAMLVYTPALALLVAGFAILLAPQ
jgi:hypothetical protein